MQRSFFNATIKRMSQKAIVCCIFDGPVFESAFPSIIQPLTAGERNAIFIQTNVRLHFFSDPERMTHFLWHSRQQRPTEICQDRLTEFVKWQHCQCKVEANMSNYFIKFLRSRYAIASLTLNSTWKYFQPTTKKAIVGECVLNFF